MQVQKIKRINAGIKIKQNNHSNDYDYLSFVSDEKDYLWSTKGMGTHSDYVLGYVKEDIDSTHVDDYLSSNVYLLPFGALPNN